LATPRTFDALEALQSFAAGRGTSMAAVALAWLLADERIAQVVTGPSRPEQLEPLREALQRPLTPDERRHVGAVFAT
jgi:aryl-alcohol dehydrogenase-like predicted oxidoreductase